MSTKHLLDLTDQLLSLLREENNLLRHTKIHEAETLHELKEQLFHSYQLAVTETKDNVAILAKSHAEVFNVIDLKTRQLRDALEENYKYIDMAAEANNRIINCLAEKLCDETNFIPRYNYKGYFPTHATHKIPPLSVNEQI